MALITWENYLLLGEQRGQGFIFGQATLIENNQYTIVGYLGAACLGLDISYRDAKIKDTSALKEG